MGKNFFVTLNLIIMALLPSSAHATEIDLLKNIKTLTEFTQSAIATKDIPATCWYLGNMSGIAKIWTRSSEKNKIKGEELTKLLNEVSGRCAGDPKSQDLAKVYDDAEWARLKIGTNKIKAFK